jgi:ubiquinone/menaquinone biosynthesis C-methylase UbiE
MRDNVSAHRPADWQLPPGVDHGLWDYLHNPDLARNYDDYLAGSSLPHVDEAFVARHCPKPGRLIDLGCGSGRLLVAFARRGYWVLGVDLSEDMLRVAGDKATAAGVAIHRLKANLVELNCLRDGGFDYAACLFSTLGMVNGVAERRRVLAHVHRLLKPGGVFVLHVHNRWFNVWSRGGRAWLWENAWRSLLRRGEAGTVRMPVHQQVAGLKLHLFTRREVVGELRRARFRIIEIRPVSLRPDGRLPWPGWFGRLRSYGYLVAAAKKSG